jgi:hypothetical protein
MVQLSGKSVPTSGLTYTLDLGPMHTEKRIPGFSGKFGNPGSKSRPGTQSGVCTQTGFLLTHQEPGFLEFSKFRDPAPGPDLDENLGSDDGDVPVLHTGLISCSTGTSIPPKVENLGSTSVVGSRVLMTHEGNDEGNEQTISVAAAVLW